MLVGKEETLQGGMKHVKCLGTFGLGRVKMYNKNVHTRKPHVHALKAVAVKAWQVGSGGQRV